VVEHDAGREREEQDLVARAVRGDRNALVILLYRYYERLLAHARRHLPEDLRRVIDAEDILQEAHRRAYQKIHTFDTRHAFYPWLAAIADHARIDALRKHRRRSPPAAGTAADRAGGCLPGLWEMLAVDEETPSRWATRREAVRAVHVALATLPPRQREAVSLVWIQGLSHEEAARAMGATREAVHSLIYRGLAELRAELGSLSDYLSRR
jgi:RNA polymerase sigma-70 factor (ECF subfamily)